MSVDFGLVSVVMAVYNGEAYLSEAIDSIIGQTYKNIEFVIVNDGSKDSSGDILNEYAAKDSRVKVITQENLGLSAALNAAILASNGQWIARMDADDISEPDRIMKQLLFIDSNGLDFCGAAVKTLGTIKDRVWNYPFSDREVRARLMFNSPFAHPVVIGRRNIFVDNKYKESGVPAEDYELWVRLASQSRLIFGNHPDVLLRYRIHPGQISTSKSLRQQKMRSDIAIDFWRSQGYQGKISSVVHFRDIQEFVEMHAYLVSVSSADNYPMLADCLANMAIRSHGLGFKFFSAFIFCNKFWPHVSSVKKAGCVFSAIFPSFMVNAALSLWFKNR